MSDERDIAVLVPDSGHGALLVASADGGVTLPTARGRWGAACALEAAREAFALDVAYLRPAGIVQDGSGNVVAALHELDAPPADWEPPEGLRWLDRAAADPNELAPRGLAHAVAYWLEVEAAVAVPELRAPWARAGWLERARSWIVARASEAGLEPIGEVAMVQQWPLSSVLRLRTSGGDVLFKSVFALFHHEPEVTATLAERHPELLPSVVARDLAEGWLLMRELPGTQLGDEDVESWPLGLSALATVHRAWGGRERELVALGAQDRTLASLASELPDLGDLAELGGEERRRLNAARPSFERCLDRLATAPLPETLAHGDFHPWNVMVDGDSVRIFDWSDACIAHPLFDLPTFVLRADEEAIRQQLVDVYLSSWRDVAPLDELRALVPLAAPLASLHHALSYAHILEALEPADRWYFADEPRNWALRAVDAVEALDEAVYS